MTVSVLWLFLTVSWVGLLCVIVIFSNFTHLLLCSVSDDEVTPVAKLTKPGGASEILKGSMNTSSKSCSILETFSLYLALIETVSEWCLSLLESFCGLQVMSLINVVEFCSHINVYIPLELTRIDRSLVY